MLEAFGWYLAVQALGWLALVACEPDLRALPSRGHGTSKALGLLLVGLGLYLGSALRLLRVDMGGAWIVVLGLLAVAIWRPDRSPLRHLASVLWQRRSQVVAAELLFAFCFFGWTLARARFPALGHTEQPMDLAMLTAAWANPTYPALDPWLAGHAVSYYAFGSFLIATMAHLTGATPALAYNLAQGLWLGLLAATCFGLGCDLATFRHDEPNEPPSRRRLAGATVVGLISAAAVTFTSNLKYPLDLINGTLRDDAWWWFDAARAFQDRGPRGEPVEMITEFPFFGTLLGDNHPHVLSLPILALLTALALASVLGKGHDEPRETSSTNVPRRPSLLLMAAGLASLWMMNGWLLPAALTLLGGAFVLAHPAPLHRAIGKALEQLVKVGGLAGVIALPFLLTGGPGVRGVLINLFGPTPGRTLVLLFGALLPGVLIAVAFMVLDIRPTARQVLTSTLFAGLAVALLRK